MTSLNTRMAIRWLEVADGRLRHRRSYVRTGVSGPRAPSAGEHYDRRPLPDNAIRQLIEEMLGRHPKLSKTVALKRPARIRHRL